MIITHDDIKKAGRSEYQWQQRSIMRRMHKVNMNVMAMGMRNRLVKRRGGIDENETGYLQRYVVRQYERIIKYLILNTNNVALQIIPSEHNFDFDFPRRRGEICPTSPTCLDRLSCFSSPKFAGTLKWRLPFLRLNFRIVVHAYASISPTGIDKTKGWYMLII
jgi:hypothetical protein